MPFCELRGKLRDPRPSARVGGAPWARMEHLSAEDRMKLTLRCVFIAVIASAIGGARWLYETSLINSLLDTPGALWRASYSTIISAATGLIAFTLCLVALRFFAQRRRVAGAVCLAGLMAVTGFTANTLVQLKDIRMALAEASNPKTDPDRLQELVGYRTGFGDEIDNRIASNPNTPVELLVSLYNKGRLGTQMCLARNPRMPDSILRKMLQDVNVCVVENLRLNPRYAAISEPQENDMSESEVSPGSDDLSWSDYLREEGNGKAPLILARESRITAMEQGALNLFEDQQALESEHRSREIR